MEWEILDDRPIWQQLRRQLTLRIVAGIYPMGSRLPSVRDLAAEAGVNPNTMQRALAALGEITGETLSEDVIDQVFARFCVGK